MLRMKYYCLLSHFLGSLEHLKYLLGSQLLLSLSVAFNVPEHPLDVLLGLVELAVYLIKLAFDLSLPQVRDMPLGMLTMSIIS
jgi:hypothetical protein